MPQNCPHCGMWLPRADATHCSQCNNDLSKPPIELEEDEDEGDEKPSPKRSVLEKMALTGNVIQLVFLVTLLLPMTGFFAYGFVRAVFAKQLGSAFGFLFLLGVFGGLLYAVIKSFLANTRK